MLSLFMIQFFMLQMWELFDEYNVYRQIQCVIGGDGHNNDDARNIMMVQLNNIMQEVVDYNFLIVGRSGAGKSATTRLLTGDPSVGVANSLNEVTNQVRFYRAISHPQGRKNIRFGVLDVPGLDRISNRMQVRQTLTHFLTTYSIHLHGILYVVSLTERDPLDKHKLFQFIKQLPWPSTHKHHCLIPILTKYDNLVIDCDDHDITCIKSQLKQVFTENGYQQAWGKRTYWVNYTKSLEFKCKSYPDVKQKYEQQIARLCKMVEKNDFVLSVNSIAKHVKEENNYVLERILELFDTGQLDTHLEKTSHQLSLSIKIQPKHLAESITAMSASSIGIIISRAIKQEIPQPLSIALMVIPLSLTLLNLTKNASCIAGKIISNESFSYKVLEGNLAICQGLNEMLFKEFHLVNAAIEFYIEGNKLYCRLPKDLKLRFFKLNKVKITVNGESAFEIDEKKETDQYGYMFMYIPKFDQETFWEPTIRISYLVTGCEEETLLKKIQQTRVQFNEQLF